MLLEGFIQKTNVRERGRGEGGEGRGPSRDGTRRARRGRSGQDGTGWDRTGQDGTGGKQEEGRGLEGRGLQRREGCLTLSSQQQSLHFPALQQQKIERATTMTITTETMIAMIAPLLSSGQHSYCEQR